MTPGSVMSMNASSSNDWMTTELEVKILPSVETRGLGGQIGAIQSVSVNIILFR